MWLFGPPNMEKLKTNRNIRGLIKALKHKDYEIRYAAANALGEIGDVRAVNALIKALGYADDTGTVEACIVALGQIGDMRAVPPLIKILMSKGSTWRGCRLAAAKAMVLFGPAAVDPFIAVLGDTSHDLDLRIFSATELGNIGDSHAIKPLFLALKDKKPGIRLAAAQSLEKIGWKPDSNEDGVIYWAAAGNWEECVKIGSSAVDPLIALLRSDEAVIRIRVIWSLGEIGDQRAVAPLVDMLRDKDQDVCKAAALALEQQLGWRPDSSVDGAYYHIAKEQWDECVKIGADAVLPLIDALRNKRLRKAVVKALGEIGDSRAVIPLTKVLEGDERGKYGWSSSDEAEQYEAELVSAAQALGEIGDVRAVTPLISALKSFYNVRKVAARILVEMFSSNKLDNAHKRLILDQRHLITEKVVHKHHDNNSDCHTDSVDEYGIGVDFPV